MKGPSEKKKTGRATSRTHNLGAYISARSGVLYIFRDSILVG
jgi:hypothetical protein